MRPTRISTPAVERDTVGGLWAVTLFPTAFGGMIASVRLAGTSTEGGAWGTCWVVLVVSEFFTLAGLVLGLLRLEELCRHGAWVPPGTDRHPVLVAIALALLSLTAGGTVPFALLWLGRLSGLAS